MARRRPTASVVALAGVGVLQKRLSALEKRVAKLEGQRNRIGFQATSVIGDRETQDEDDPDVPDEVP